MTAGHHLIYRCCFHACDNDFNFKRDPFFCNDLDFIQSLSFITQTYSHSSYTSTTIPQGSIGVSLWHSGPTVSVLLG